MIIGRTTRPRNEDEGGVMDSNILMMMIDDKVFNESEREREVLKIGSCYS